MSRYGRGSPVGGGPFIWAIGRILALLHLAMAIG
jgi:hypothetical protein